MSLQTPSPKARHIEIVEEVASREGVSPLDLPALYHSVDPDVLDSLTSPGSDNVSITFTYCGYDVTVDRNDRITIDGSD